VALGLTRASGNRSPFAPCDPADEVWSARTGRWRRVRVVRGGGLMFGAPTAMTFVAAVPALLFSGIWALLLSYLTRHLTPSRLIQIWPVALLGLGWLLWTVGNVWFVRMLYYSVYDLTRPPRTIVGQVVYLESHVHHDAENPDTFYTAVDDGTTDRIVKYEIGRTLHDRLRYGTWLRLQVRPKLGAVVSAEIIAPPGPPRPEP
jgi:hypothetical protein